MTFSAELLKTVIFVWTFWCSTDLKFGFWEKKVRNVCCCRKHTVGSVLPILLLCLNFGIILVFVPKLMNSLCTKVVSCRTGLHFYYSRLSGQVFAVWGLNYIGNLRSWRTRKTLGELFSSFPPTRRVSNTTKKVLFKGHMSLRRAK